MRKYTPSRPQYSRKLTLAIHWCNLRTYYWLLVPLGHTPPCTSPMFENTVSHDKILDLNALRKPMGMKE